VVNNSLTVTFLKAVTVHTEVLLKFWKLDFFCPFSYTLEWLTYAFNPPIPVEILPISHNTVFQDCDVEHYKDLMKSFFSKVVAKIFNCRAYCRKISTVSLEDNNVKSQHDNVLVLKF
jgi:hypothetical protein